MITSKQLFSRRSFLIGSSSAIALGTTCQPVLAAGLNKNFNQTIFGALIRAIAGPVEISKPLLASTKAAFITHYGLAALQAFVDRFVHNGIFTVLDKQTDKNVEDQIQWIALYLYTGSADPLDDKAPLTNYPYALGWKSLRFAKAPGLCSGPEFGYWLTPWSAT